MAKKAMSLTLGESNVLWLHAVAARGDVRSVSELVDQLITSARDRGAGAAPRSVVGTIDIDRSDPGLEHADDAIRTLFDQSLSRPFLVRERPTTVTVSRRRKPRRG
ncbi:MAG: hypothetical protein LC804_13850 [Acidobacteria bacterium]|nr:hypothetical protein [Acidobacteriota bacterium]